MGYKTETDKLKRQRKLSPRLLLAEFSLLFYIGKYFGGTTYDYQEFRKYKRLKRSPGSDCLVIIAMIIVFINFNLMVGVFENTSYLVEKNMLSVVIGFVLTYFSLFAYLVDRFTALRKQNQLIEIFETLQELEEDFDELGLTLNNSFIKYRIMLSLLFTVILESLIFVFTFTLLVDRSCWTSWLWIFTALPTFGNTLDKIWYISIITVIRKRFDVINSEFNRTTVNLQSKNQKNTKMFVLSALRGIMFKMPTVSTAKIYPQQSKLGNNSAFAFTNSQQKTKSMATLENALTNLEILSAMPYEILEERFKKLCQLHDGLCGVANQMNKLWAVQNLVVMGYGFFIITAQLYFLYCSKAAQLIPSLFRPASNFGILAINLFYVASKCVRILYVNWQTILVAKKTGICIHRCGLAADRNDVYEMVNHLSLKLFNHVITFNACGFFSLDMATLFAVCGGITTYLIILIQFNMEEQQVRFAGDGKTQQYFLGNDSTEAVLQKNVTSLIKEIYYYYISGNNLENSTN